MGTFILLAFVGLCIFGAIKGFQHQSKTKEKKKQGEFYLISSGATKWYFDSNSNYIGWTGQDIILGFEKINRHDIRAVKLIRDGEIIFEKSSVGTAGRALVGGALLGGFGALVGASSGSSKGKQRINSIDLEIRTSNENQPTFRFNFYDRGQIAKLAEITRTAEEWAALLETVIDNNKEAQK